MASKTLSKLLKSRPWIELIDDERAMGNSIIVMLKGVYCFNDDPRCGTQGFDTVKEVEARTRKDCVYEDKTL